MNKQTTKNIVKAVKIMQKRAKTAHHLMQAGTSKDGSRVYITNSEVVISLTPAVYAEVKDAANLPSYEELTPYMAIYNFLEYPHNNMDDYSAGRVLPLLLENSLNKGSYMNIIKAAGENNTIYMLMAEIYTDVIFLCGCDDIRIAKKNNEKGTAPAYCVNVIDEVEVLACGINSTHDSIPEFIKKMFEDIAA